MFRFNNMIVLKVTKDCNLRCEYCYIKNKDNFKGQIMKFDVFKKIINKITKDRILQEIEDTEFSLVFHGGEPLMMPDNLFANMLEYANNVFARNNIKFSFNMQSNLTLLTDEKVALLSKYNVVTGASFDGVDGDNTKRTQLGQEFFEKKFKKLEEHNVSYGFLLVAGEQNIKNTKVNTDFLKNKYGQENIKVNYVEDVVGIGGEVDGKTFFEYGWKPYLDEYIETGICREGNCVQLIKNFIHTKLTNETVQTKTNCGSAFCGAGINIIEIEPDGRVFYCGRYSEDYDVAYVQPADQYDFLALHQIKRFIDFSYEKNLVIKDVGCDSCFAKSICDHGCMAFHYSKFQKWGIRTDLVCDIYKSAWMYLDKNAVGLFRGLVKTDKEATFHLGRKDLKIKIDNKVFQTLKSKYSIYVQQDEENTDVIRITDTSKGD